MKFAELTWTTVKWSLAFILQLVFTITLLPKVSIKAGFAAISWIEFFLAVTNTSVLVTYIIQPAMQFTTAICKVKVTAVVVLISKMVKVNIHFTISIYHCTFVQSVHQGSFCNHHLDWSQICSCIRQSFYYSCCPICHLGHSCRL